MNPEAVKTLAGYLAQVLKNEHTTTKKLLAALPDSKLSWQPHPKAFTAGKLAWHIATAELWFLDGLVAGKYEMGPGPEAPATVAEILAFYEKNFAAAWAKVEALPVEAMSRKIAFFDGSSHPAYVYLTYAANHSIHHRGQLSTYLRAMGEHVPATYGDSADEPFDMQKAQTSA